MLERCLRFLARLHQDLAQPLAQYQLLARLQRCAAYAFLRACIRISRSRLPRISSSPGCSVALLTPSCALASEFRAAACPESALHPAAAFALLTPSCALASE